MKKEKEVKDKIYEIEKSLDKKLFDIYNTEKITKDTSIYNSLELCYRLLRIYHDTNKQKYDSIHLHKVYLENLLKENKYFQIYYSEPDYGDHDRACFDCNEVRNFLDDILKDVEKIYNKTDNIDSKILIDKINDKIQYSIM